MIFCVIIHHAQLFIIGFYSQSNTLEYMVGMWFLCGLHPHNPAAAAVAAALHSQWINLMIE